MTMTILALAKQTFENSLVGSSIGDKFEPSSLSVDTSIVYNISPLLAVTIKLASPDKVRLTIGLNYQNIGSGSYGLSVYYRGCDIRRYLLSCECLTQAINRTVTSDNAKTLQRAFSKWIEEVCVPAIHEMQVTYDLHTSQVDLEYEYFSNYAKIMNESVDSILSGKSEREQYEKVSTTHRTYFGFNYAFSKSNDNKKVWIDRSSNWGSEKTYRLAIDGLTFEQSQKLYTYLENI